MTTISPNGIPPTTDKALQLIESAVGTMERAGDSLKELPDFVEKRTSFSLMAVGAVVIVIGLAMMVNFDDYHLADLAPAEFIAVLVLGLCLMGLGALGPVARVRSTAQVEVKKLEEGSRLVGELALQLRED